MNTPTDVDPRVSEQLLALQARANVERQLRNGANWFFWIAGLSLIDFLMMWSSDHHKILEGGQGFLAGLAVTQLISIIVYSIVFLGFTSYPPVTVTLLTVVLVALGLHALVASVFVFFGVFARKHHAWSFIVGMILYALDALLALLFGSYLLFAFHLWALFGLFTGLRALKQVRALRQFDEVLVVTQAGTIRRVKRLAPYLHEKE